MSDSDYEYIYSSAEKRGYLDEVRLLCDDVIAAGFPIHPLDDYYAATTKQLVNLFGWIKYYVREEYFDCRVHARRKFLRSLDRRRIALEDQEIVERIEMEPKPTVD